MNGGAVATATLLLGQLARLRGACNRTQRDLEIHMEAFAIYVKLWFAHTPGIPTTRRTPPVERPRAASRNFRSISSARTARLLRPRQTRSLAVAPVVVTDLSAAAVVGLERRSFRELVRDLKIPHVRRGQRILVDVEVLREVLASASTREVNDAPAGIEGDADENQGPTASELLQRLERTRVGGG
jgi:hypothetical protein